MTREGEALLEERPHPLVDDQARPNNCSVLLAKSRSSKPTPSATFQRRSKSARALASSSDCPLAGF